MTQEWCLQCGASFGGLVGGDCAMCTQCGQWHFKDAEEHDVRPVTKLRAAELAREKMDRYEVLAALQRNADAMLGIFHGRRVA